MLFLADYQRRLWGLKKSRKNPTLRKKSQIHMTIAKRIPIVYTLRYCLYLKVPIPIGICFLNKVGFLLVQKICGLLEYDSGVIFNYSLLFYIQSSICFHLRVFIPFDCFLTFLCFFRCIYSAPSCG